MTYYVLIKIFLQFWCHEGRPSVCPNGGKRINTNNKELCSNNTFWKGVSCHVHSHGEVDTVESFGHRCTGSSQQCVYPWYRNNHGNIFAQSACSDKSDKVFPSDAPCPNSTSFMEIHNSLFCSNSSEISSYYICTHPADWVGQQTDARYEDPHGCWDSCSAPGPNCAACTNSAYFMCQQSGKCIHPDLVCDGHPQASI